MRNEIGISLASGLPWSAYFPNNFLRKVKEMGYKFVGILPFRLAGQLDTTIVPIRYIEKAWNDGCIWSYIHGKITGCLQSSGLHDVAFFASTNESEKLFRILKKQTRAQGVVHEYANLFDNPDNLLEISPGLWADPTGIVKEIVVTSGFRQPFVIDTYHLRRKPRDDERAKVLNLDGISRLGDWKESLPLFLPHTSLIHVSPNRDNDELQSFISGEKTELEEMLRLILAGGYKGPMMVEATLGLGGFNYYKLLETLDSFLRHLKAI